MHRRPDKLPAVDVAQLVETYWVQVGYFARRCANDVRTGINSEDENHKGLRHARNALGVPS